MKPSTLRAHHIRIPSVLAYLETHLEEPPDLTTLARLAGVSPRHFERVFARIVGESPRACLRRLKLERAARQLRATRRGILTLALDAGFESHEAFTRSFKKRFGQTPAAYRGLPQAGQQPRNRESLWRQALATGLRRHVEQPRGSNRSPASHRAQ